MLTLVLLCALISSQGAQAWTIGWTTEEPSCRHYCGHWMWSCSCSSSCEYSGNCCSDYYTYCGTSTPEVTTGTTVEVTPQTTETYTQEPSCRYDCGGYVGSCSCTDSCGYHGDCCSDYYTYCGTTTQEPATEDHSCRYNCGWHFGSCSCKDSCDYYGNCCSDYYTYCGTTTPEQTTLTTADVTPDTYTQEPSCRYNCGWSVGSCSCRDSCDYYGNCCSDYYTYCGTNTPTTAEVTTETYTHDHSCRYNCGWDFGSCSCSFQCEYLGGCCSDYYSYCGTTTQEETTATTAEVTTDTYTQGHFSCWFNCGYYLGSCSCDSSCVWYGNCCYDYYLYCGSSTSTEPAHTTEPPSCRYNCGHHMGSCSCYSSCRYYGNCCNDYYDYCSYTTMWPEPTTENPSCRYNCGSHMGSCSCYSSCRYYGNCCNDYYDYCSYTTMWPEHTTDNPSCRYNCGYHMGNCSCSSSCEYRGNCCRDYYAYCYHTTTNSPSVTGGSCGGSLSGSGSFSSPNYPGYYYDNAYCVWQISASSDQNIYLTFTSLQLENCCSCDYIAVYDGPSVGSRLLGKVCEDNYNSSQSAFHSSSNYLTVLFRTDSSVVARGFQAEFTSSLSSHLGRVECSSDNMEIVIDRSYLNSLGIDAYNLYVNDQYCRPSISYYNVVFKFPINTCGTVREFHHDRIVYTNALRSFASDYGDITRQSVFRLNVNCRMEQDSVSQIIYEVGHNSNTSISGSGRYNTSMAFYTSGSFYYQITQVPYEVRLNQDLYVQVSLRRGDDKLVLFLDTCVTSPSPHDFQTRTYDLIRNGCRVDSTFYTYSSGTSPYARFRFKAFQFLRATEHVYIQCKVLICPASDYDSRCRRGCSRRKARDLGTQHESETVVLGPIQLLEPEGAEDDAQEETKG